jgi:hypothetical protein
MGFLAHCSSSFLPGLPAGRGLLLFRFSLR